MNLILHIGTEKTGTTTIQEFLHLNREPLANYGIYFPKSIGLRNHRPLASWCLTMKRSDDYLRLNGLVDASLREVWKKKFIKDFDAELQNINPDITHILLSSEHFSALLNYMDEIEALKNLLSNWFYDIKIIVYLRRQDMLTTSLLSTYCRVGIVNDKILPDTSNLRFYFNYWNLLEKWAAIFGSANIQPKVFETSEFKNNNLLSDFISVCGLPEHLNYVRPESKNLSYSEIAHDAVQLFNKKYQVLANQMPDTFLQKIRLELLDNLTAKYPGPGKKPLRHDAIAFYHQFEKSNQEVARKWFNREKLFTEDFTMYPETAKKANEELNLMEILFQELETKMDILKSYQVKES